MTDWNMTVDSGEEAKVIVTSMRIYIHACSQAGSVPKPSHLFEIAFGIDPATKALIEVAKEDQCDESDAMDNKTALAALVSFYDAWNEDGCGDDPKAEADESIGWNGDGSEMKLTYGDVRLAAVAADLIRGEG